MHIARTEDGKYVIRKFSLLGLCWDVADFNGKDTIQFWWPESFMKWWTKFDTKDDAMLAALRHKCTRKNVKHYTTRFERWI